MPPICKVLCNPFLCALLFNLVCSAALALEQETAEGFPGRALFSTIPVMEISVLYARLDDVHVVDVRSQYEYETLHIKGARHIDLQSTLFAEEARDLLEQQDKPVVFYCNGKTCYKSYEAVDKVKNAGIKKVYAFDAGIFDWARVHPAHSVLLGGALLSIRGD